MAFGLSTLCAVVIRQNPSGWFSFWNRIVIDSKSSGVGQKLPITLLAGLGEKDELYLVNSLSLVLKLESFCILTSLKSRCILQWRAFYIIVGQMAVEMCCHCLNTHELSGYSWWDDLTTVISMFLSTNHIRTMWKRNILSSENLPLTPSGKIKNVPASKRGYYVSVAWRRRTVEECS